ncbi:DNA-directed RNA polymerase I subunit RPA49-like [Venturia canescens]|uniref:DNA-directed RNA polymerase I subunit RPA49-like n=1 Tax=Venturia canescens TaxID=32260 RepID=UPI001C9BBE46|nr:DNA-directed RNA polymerase I subunit RPA49-like [Venturia canescens]
MTESTEAVIDEVIIQPSKIQPIIVNFQNGALKDEETSRMDCGVYYDKKKQNTVLAMSNGQIVYKGYRPDSEKELTYTMLAIHSKRTGKIKLIQAERWEVAPVLDKQVQIDETLSNTEKIGALNKQFGSKKIKRRTELHERLRINISSAQEQLEKSVADIEIDRADLSVKSVDNDSSTNDQLPPCNREALNPKDVYNVYDIVPEDVLQSVYDKIDEIIESNTEGKSEFYVKTMKHIQSESKKNKKIAMLEYIQTVETWFEVPFRDVKKRGLQIYPHSEQLNNYIIETYSMVGANGRQRPTTMKDKGIIHCMIMALMLWNFTLDIELFITLFSNSRVGLKKFTDLARIIGAMPSKENKKLFCLKIPLPAPLSTVRKGRGKKLR